MTRPGRDDDPDRLYTVTGGRSRPDTDAFDVVTLVVAESGPAPGMQSEHAAILTLCRAPTAVVEIAAELRLPVGITIILLSDLLLSGKITARHPRPGAKTPDGHWYSTPDTAILEKVLSGLRKL
ncbi:DUF742 domain-containing protein [Nocardia terpenica]|uniref:DUF742 domain-containing protein n=1 Tax=Nocardia terpenica TaxID=455432 RepID=A0A161XH59_9NOCA|nr:DUF742 domain-containing protein [Nocardia terpenica]ATL67851.1 DUF742 domain-containing protein [Nocardia terpenica]KZM72868.1 hypothetical protein AWN90_29350 [Nocardia terpenica]MBF6061220.1 DUF742 domain-containing protein [Nocardia terpenica]MBF6105551.1 DUF742 domain-containing protein [Nocardia terpenica]MBF6112979.1 DUF742 domain-containing protein [Nocardia terpenica]